MILEDGLQDIVRKAMVGIGMDMEGLSKRSGIPEGRLVAIMSGSLPGPEEVLLISEALNLRGDRLLAIAEGRYKTAVLPRWVEERLITVRGHLSGYEVKAYILGDRTGMLIDTATDPEGVVRAVREAGITLRAVFITHNHRDHVGGIERIVRDLGIPVYSGEDIPGIRARRPDDGGRVDVDGITVTTIWVPGHTRRSFAYYTEGMCFVGDTIFAGSIGRSNPPSLYTTHLRSIREKLLSLPDDTVLLPGHGPPTTVGEERRSNPFL